MWVRLSTHVNEAGLLFVGKNTPRPNFTAYKGLYLLEGSSITPAGLASVLDLTAEPASSAAPAAGRIKTHWLTDVGPARGIAVDQGYDEYYLETGSLTGGTIQGLQWGPSRPIGNRFWPLHIRYSNVTFSGNTATGTLRYVFRVAVRPSDPIEAWRAEATVTFTAQRIQ
jgi:hypothetical protein